ncbi:MAG: metallophosphoesterase [Rhodocyclaceae bacterium]|nr:MAG: metallophosphoesterase [Rhodocyclaceae bacterium]TND03372.1 MAG: metallophosphoesterase [Rhodocyclaceae bacterium]
MKIAVLSDIHSNLEALQACLGHAEREGAAMHVFLGDLVGYGADPAACLGLLADYAAKGALLVRGNHDEAALGGLCENMNFVAREATYWTRKQLSSGARDFLASLPFAARRGDLFFLHASADAPEKWDYISSALQAGRCMDAAQASVTFAGHVHHQSLFFSAGSSVRAFQPVPGVAIPLGGRRRWLAIAGSVGQPRDGNNAAAYVLYDEERRLLTFFRVPYDHMTAARKIIEAGLPERLAWRLQRGE